MAGTTYTWNGGTGSAIVASNWSPNGIPGTGDTAIVLSGDVVLPTDVRLVGGSLEVGSATLSFTGDLLTNFGSPTADANTVITNLVSSVSTAESTVVNSAGVFVNQGNILADGPSGCTFTVNIVPNGTVPGYFINYGSIVADAGNDLTINVGSTSALFNAGRVVANGGSVFVDVAANALDGGYAGVSAPAIIEDGGTIETNISVASTLGYFGPIYVFADATPGNTLKIDDIKHFYGGIRGFGPGDTIDLGQALSIGTIVFGSTLGSDSVLLMENAAGTVLASLLISGVHDYGTFAVVGGAADGFDFRPGADGDTLLTTTAVPAVWNNTSGTWQTASGWSTGMVPGTTASTDIGLDSIAAFTITTGSSPLTTSGFTLGDPNALVKITTDTTLQQSSGPSSVVSSGINEFGGTIEVTGANTLTASSLSQFSTNSQLLLDPGSLFDVLGSLNNSVPTNGSIAISVGNTIGLRIAGTAVINDATLNAGPVQTVAGADGGSVYIGYGYPGTPATVTVENGGVVSDTFSVLGSDPTSFGMLTLSGSRTNWTDAGDPNDPLNSRGYMIVGDNGYAGNVPTGVQQAPYSGAALLTIENGATLTEESRAYIGDTVDSAGSVTVASNGLWNIGYANGGYLDVALAGQGALTVNGGTVEVGNVGTILSNGTTSTGGGIGVGFSANASGTVTVENGGLLLDAGGISVSRGGAGTLDVLNGGTVDITAHGVGVGQSAGAAGIVVVDNALLTLGTASTGIGVGIGGAGTLEVLSGGTVANRSSLFAISVGETAAGGMLVSGAGALVTGNFVGIGYLGQGTLDVLNGGSLSTNALVAGEQPGATGSGTIIVSGAGSDVTVQSEMEIGLERPGSLSVSSGGSLDVAAGYISFGGYSSGSFGETSVGSVTNGSDVEAATGLFVWTGSTLSVDGSSAIDIGTHGSFIAGAVDIESGASLVGNGFISAALVNNGTVIASKGTVGAGATTTVNGGTLELGGSVIGTGSMSLTAATALRIDGALGSGQSVAFTSGAAETLILVSPGSGLSNAINSVQLGDTIEFGNGMTIDSAKLIGNALTLAFHGSGGASGSYVLSDVNVAAVPEAQFVPGTDQTTGFSDVEYQARTLDWTGASNTNFANAANWDDVTDNLNPAAAPPDGNTIAQFVGAGGTISGTGTAGQLQFAGTGSWILNSATLTDTAGFVDTGSVRIGNGSTVLNQGTVGTIDGAGAAVSVTGAGALFNAGTSIVVGLSHGATLSAASDGLVVASTIAVGGSGMLVAANGGSITTNDLQIGSSSGSPASISVDAASRIEVGTAGTGAAGALTLDSFLDGVFPQLQISGNTTISANLVNNGGFLVPDLSPGVSLEVTGSLAGSGSVEIEAGFASTVNGTVTVVVPGATLQLDSSVASSASVEYFEAVVSGAAPVLRLLEPAEFAGTLNSFSGIGDILDLVGETVTGASINGSGSNTTLTVDVLAGGPLTFKLSNTPAPTNLAFSGSNITVVPQPTYVWTGAADSNFANAANWDDITDNLNPAASPPNGHVVAEFLSGGGTITGTGTVGHLQFGGSAPWVVSGGAVLNDDGGIVDNGTLTIQSGSTIVDTGGSLVVAGTSATAASLVVSGTGSLLNEVAGIQLATSGSASLRAINGGAIVAAGLTAGTSFSSRISIDAASKIEIGTAGTGALGALTIDRLSPLVDLAGTIAANLVNNGQIITFDGTTLEAVGSASGAGQYSIESGFTSTVSGTVSVIPGAVLQFDSSVAGGASIFFFNTTLAAEAPTLRLLDPGAFDGTLEYFTGIGDTLDLEGDTVVGASISGGAFATDTTLTATLAAGGTLTFALFETPATTRLSVSGSDITVAPAMTDVWTGASDTNFGNAANWNDVTDNINPAASAPGTTVVAEFLSGGGSITGFGRVQQLVFGGPTPWSIANGASLASVNGVSVSGHVTIEAGATIADTGGTVAVSGSSGVAGTLVVSGPGALLSETGEVVVGEFGAGAGLVDAINGGSIVVGSILSMAASSIIAVVSVDATSHIEIGSAGTATAGAITVDPSGGGVEPQIVGDGTIVANLVNNGVVFAGSESVGGTLEITGSVTGNGWFYIDAGFVNLTPGAVVQFDSSVGSGQQIEFFAGSIAAAAPTLRLLDPQGFDGTLNGFSSIGDTLDLVGQTVTAASISGSALDVTLAAGGTLSFNLSNTPVSTGLSVSGSDVVVEAAPCFAAGTLIRTTRGEVAVEGLVVGDNVLTIDGNTQPVIWIGRRSVDCTRHPAPQKVWPVRISAGALAKDQPRRDLCLSPDHAVFVDDVLIPVRYLVNGTSIVQTPVDTVSYYHVELPRHDILFAEGLPAESYLDTGDRRNFANGGGAIVLYPDFASRVWDAEGYAPLVITGPLLEAVRQRIVALASSRSPAPALHSPRRRHRQHLRR